MVWIENAHETEFEDLFNAASRSAVQVAFVLSILDKQAVFNVTLHLLSTHEVVIDTVHLSNLRRP